MEEKHISKPHPVQIVTSNEEDDVNNANKFSLNESALRGILSKVPKDMLVSVISVVGAFRTGKSFLLTLFLRYLRQSGKEENNLMNSDKWLYAEGDKVAEGNNNLGGHAENMTDDGGFAWRGGHDRMTTGIWMWSDPFIHFSSSLGKEVAILLIDTQGMFDNETTMNLTAQIFGISTLVSSFQIYNVQNSIGEDKLMHLALFSEYGRMALHPPSDNVEIDSKDGNNSNSKDRESISVDKGSGEMNKKPFHFEEETSPNKLKPFQTLLFLVRDWPNFEESLEIDMIETSQCEISTMGGIEEKILGEMRSYFRTVIGVRGQSDLQSTRDQISRCFETVSAFLLPHPGTAVTKKNYNGSLDVVDPLFKRLVGLLTRRIFEESLEPKRVHTRNITAPELLAYFRVYTDLFKSDSNSFPPAMTMLDATAEANNRNAYDLAFAKYKESMDESVETNGYLSPANLRNIHEDSVQRSWRVFKSIANMGSRKAIEKQGAKLNDDILREYNRAAETNELRNPFRAFEYYFFPIAVAVISWLVSVLIHYTCAHDVCISIKSILSNIYGFLLVLGLIVFWQNIRMALKYVSIMLKGDTFSSSSEFKGLRAKVPDNLKRKAD